MTEFRATRFERQYETTNGPVTVRVNRRGATKPWSKESETALESLVRAVVGQLPSVAQLTQDPPTTEASST